MNQAPRIVDGDTHYYEPRDCFTRFIEPAFRDRAITVEEGDDGSDVICWQGRRLDLVAFNFFDEAPRPGALKEMMRAIKDGGTLREVGTYEAMRPEWTTRGARLAAMDAQGVERTVLYPTLGILFEHHLRDDVDAVYANIRAFNRWLDEDWGFAFDDRVYAAPLLSLRDPDRAVEEVKWVLERGARVAFMRPGHAHFRSPADPVFDPFWARVEEAGLLVGFHMAESGYNELYSVHFGEAPNPTPHEKSALQWSCFYGDRPIMDTMAALILHNLFGRFPGLRVISVENGSLWVPYLLAQMDKMKGMGRSGPWLGGRVDGRPSDIFREHVLVSPFIEEPVEDLVALIGADAVVFGSDFPHPEGIAEPAEVVAELTRSLGPVTAGKVLYGNCLRFLDPVAAGDPQ